MSLTVSVSYSIIGCCISKTKLTNSWLLTESSNQFLEQSGREWPFSLDPLKRQYKYKQNKVYQTLDSLAKQQKGYEELRLVYCLFPICVVIGSLENNEAGLVLAVPMNLPAEC